jgi:hypothetical protein
VTSRDFCYWLQGFFELSDPHSGLTQEQADTIEKHLALVFKHEIDPSQGSPAHQAELNKIHEGSVPTAQPPKHQIGGTGSDGTVYRC